MKRQVRTEMTLGEEYETGMLLSQVNDGMLPGEIARWLSREPHTVSACLKRMQNRGLVSCARVSEGKSRVPVDLTERGKDILPAQHQKRKVIREILGYLSPEERVQFRTCLEKLRQKALESVRSSCPFPKALLPASHSAHLGHRFIEYRRTSQSCGPNTPMQPPV